MILSAFKIRSLNKEIKELRELLNHIVKKPGRHRKKVITNNKYYAIIALNERSYNDS